MQRHDKDTLFPFLNHFIDLEDPYETALVRLIFSMIEREARERMEINQVSIYLTSTFKLLDLLF